MTGSRHLALPQNQDVTQRGSKSITAVPEARENTFLNCFIRRCICLKSSPGGHAIAVIFYIMALAIAGRGLLGDLRELRFDEVRRGETTGHTLGSVAQASPLCRQNFLRPHLG